MANKGADSRTLEIATGSDERAEVVVRWAASTIPGNVRAVNEDALLAVPGMFVVADGMGGHVNGDIASRLIVESCHAASPGVPLALSQLEQLVNETNRRVVDYALAAGINAMGSTLVALALIENAGQLGFVVLNIGDSRCYALNTQGELDLVTRDHSVVQELLDDGRVTAEQSRVHPERHVITRAVGLAQSVAADFVILPPLHDRRVLLCSDGVSGELSDGVIESLMNAHDMPAGVVDALLSAVASGPAPDNATAVVVDITWNTSATKSLDSPEFATTNPRAGLVEIQ